MSEDCSESEQDGAPNVGGLIIRFAAAFAENIGKEKTADVIRYFPEHLARLLSAPLRQRLEENKNQTLPSDLIDEIQEEVLDNPKLASAVAIQYFEKQPNLLFGKAQSKEIVRTYGIIADMISEIVDIVEADIAVKGFFHDKNCVSIWQKSRLGKTKNFRTTEQGELSRSLNAKVYFIPSKSVDEDFSAFNQQIRMRSINAAEFIRKLMIDNLHYYEVIQIDDLRVHCKDPEAFANPPIQFLIDPVKTGIPDMISSIAEILECHSQQLTDLKSVLEKNGISIPENPSN